MTEFHRLTSLLTVATSDDDAKVLCRPAHRITLRQRASRITRAFGFASLAELRMQGALAPIWQFTGCIARLPIVEPTLDDSDDGAGDCRA